MPKVKISEFDVNPDNNTDINNINIAEGCAPSGINNAIRQLMSDLKEFQTGAGGDPFNGAVNGTVGATTPATGAFTTLSASSTVSGTGFSTYLASPPAIGGTAAAAGAFTSLSASGAFSANGGTTLGDASGDALTINSSAVSIPNGLNFDSNTFVIDATNNYVGIGTASPTDTLNVGAFSGSNNITIGSGTTGAGGLYFGDGTGADRYRGYVAYQHTSDYFEIGTAGSERMRITSTGDVVIGSTSVLGGGKFSLISPLASANGVVVRDSSATYANNNNFVLLQNSAGSAIGGLTHPAVTSLGIWGVTDTRFFNTNGATEVMRLDAVGNLGLGVTPSAWASSWKALQIGGQSLARSVSGAGDWTMAFNAYFDTTDSRWEYLYTGDSSVRYSQTGAGIHAWYTSGSGGGTANNPITFTQAMTLDASGNLGVGTTSPAAKLNTSIAAGAISATNVHYLLSETGTNTSTGMQIKAINSSNSWDAGAITFRRESTANSYGLIFDTSSGGTNAERMRLDSSGNLGLGVTPATWASGWKTIQVGATGVIADNNAGDVYFGSNWALTTTGDKYLTTNFANVYAQINGQHQWYNAPSGTAGATPTFTQAMTLDADGDLGVGTTNPLYKLHINSGTVNTVAVFESTDATAIIGFKDNSTTNIPSIGAVADVMIFNTGAAERMRIDSNGLLIVGTGSLYPFAKIQATATSTVNGAIAATQPNSATGAGVTSGSVTIAGTGWYHFVGQSGNGSAITTNDILIYGNGNIQNTNNSYGSLSDIKLKENIVDATPKLEKLMQVKVRNYNLKDNYEQHKQIGVIAQELEQIFPSMVEETQDRDVNGNTLETTTKAVKYSVFVPILIKAMQEQQAIINDLKARIETLESK
jgi:hypothetical protein